MTAIDMNLMLQDLGRLVSTESKTGDQAGLWECGAVLAEIGDRLLAPHASGEIITTAAGPIVCWTFGASRTNVVLVGHFDTVFPEGVLSTFPFTVEGDIVRGPGTFDMKAGLLVALYGCAEALRRDPHALDGVMIFCNPDEEDGSKASRPHFRALADEGLSAAFVFEGGSATGDVCSSRMGGMWVDVTFAGVAAHGSRPDLGANALTALARYVSQLQTVADAHPGSTIAPTMANAGDAINTVAASAQLTLDTRSPTDEQQQSLLDALTGIETNTEGVVTTLSVLHRFAPMELASSVRAVVRMREVCKKHGLAEPNAGMGYGITDANHLSAMGVEVLDGLGPRGGDEHSPNEWMSVSSMAERVELVSHLIPDAVAHFSS